MKRPGTPVRRVRIRPRNEARQAKRRRTYQAHLHSAYWQTVRALIWQRSGGSCERCRTKLRSIGSMHGAHQTYRRFGHEWLSDVEASCFGCNNGERAQQNWFKGNRAT